MNPRFSHHARGGAAATAFLAAGLLATGLAWSQEPSPTPGPGGEAPAAESAPQPRLEVVDREVDLGRIYRGQKAEGRFELRNSGDAVLHIQRVKPG